MGGYHGGKTLQERFNEKWVEGENGCWNWRFQSGRVATPRAGTFSLNGHIMTAYRASYIMHKGPIPDGLLVCHTCDNGLCVNPGHLWVGTYSDNNTDTIIKNRRGPTPQKGVTHTFAKLTEDNVRHIRAVMQADPPRGTFRRLAREFGICTATLQDVISGKTWKHVMPD